MDMHSLFVWLVVGAVAGWLVGLLLQGNGFGFWGDLVVGIIGGVIGGALTSFLGIDVGGGMIVSIATATAGGVLLVLLLRLMYWA